jgi:hypothetical protein
MKFLNHFLIACLIFTAAPAFAQKKGVTYPRASEEPVKPNDYRASEQKVDPTRELDYISGPQYMTLVHLAISKRPKNFEFGTLRALYPLTPQYDPIGEATRKKIVNLAFTIENDPDTEKRKKAFEEYGETVSQHLANIDVVSQALILSQQDKIYGDPKFFEWVRTGLLRSIMNSGDGRSLHGAYDAMTLGEEAFLMNILGLTVLKSESEHSGVIYYNMHQVRDKKVRMPYWMFVDVTYPLEFLEKQKQRQGNNFSIRAQ